MGSGKGAIIVGRGPISDIGVDADLLVVSNPADHSVSFVRADDYSLAGGAALDGEPFAVAVRDNRAYVGVSSIGFDALAAVDTGSGEVVATYPLADTRTVLTALAVHPDGKNVFAARSGAAGVEIAVVDTTADDFSSIPVAIGRRCTIDAVAAVPNGLRLYAAVSGAFDGRVVAVDIDEARPIHAVPIGCPIRGLAVTPQEIVVLAMHPRLGGVVHRIDVETHEVMETMTVGGSPTQMVLDPEGDRAYVVYRNRIEVMDVEKLRVVDTITVGTRPSCVAVGAHLHVADYRGAITRYPAAPA